MRRRSALSLLTRTLMLLGLSSRRAGADAHEGTFASAALGTDVAYAVWLPSGYRAEPDRRWPLLVLLHGLFEHHTFWQRRGLSQLLTTQAAAGHAEDYIVAAVDGGRSFFVDGPAGRYQQLVAVDFPAFVAASYRCTARRDLLGVSMGGYAALRLALTRPGAFHAVVAHSAMVLGAIPTRAQGASEWHMAAFHNAFGDPIDAELWRRNDPLALAQQASPAQVGPLYFDCGRDDRYGLARGNAELHRRLEARGIAHEFELAPGDHGYDYVRSRLARSLGFLRQQRPS